MNPSDAVAANRAAEAMLRSLGGGKVVLSISAGSLDGRGLGLTSPSVEEVEVGPAVLHRDDNGVLELLVAASTLLRQSRERGVCVAELCNLVVGVRVGDVVKRIGRIMSESFAGAEYLYRFAVAE